MEKNFVAALGLILTLAQTSPKSSETSYADFIGRADLVAIARLEHAELNADRDQLTWTAKYHINEVLKGIYTDETVTLVFDSESFKKTDSSDRGTKETHNLLILFLHAGDDGKFDYAGPPLNSPSIIASAANLAILRQEFAQSGRTPAPDRKIIIFALIAAVLVVLLIVVAVKLRRPGRARDSEELPQL